MWSAQGTAFQAHTSQQPLTPPVSDYTGARCRNRIGLIEAIQFSLSILPRFVCLHLLIFKVIRRGNNAPRKTQLHSRPPSPALGQPAPATTRRHHRLLPSARRLPLQLGLLFQNLPLTPAASSLGAPALLFPCRLHPQAQDSPQSSGGRERGGAQALLAPAGWAGRLGQAPSSHGGNAVPGSRSTGAPAKEVNGISAQ